MKILSVTVQSFFHGMTLLASWLTAYWLPLIVGVLLSIPVPISGMFAGMLLVMHVVFIEAERRRLREHEFEKAMLPAQLWNRMQNICRNAGHDELADRLLQAREEERRFQ